MASFRCYDNSDVIVTLTMTNFHLNTTVVAIFPNACLWRRSLYSDLVLTLKTNCIKPPSYVSTAYVVVIRPSFLSDSFVKIWATCEIFWGKWFTAPPANNFPYAYVCTGGGMPKITLGIRRNFGSGLRDWRTLLGTLRFHGSAMNGRTFTWNQDI